MNQNTTIESHSVGRSLILHLLPGALIGAAYFALITPVHNWGYPSMLALMIAIPLILVPFESGYLLYQGKLKNGHFTLRGVLSYLSPIPAWQYILWVPLLLVLLGIIFTLLKPLDSLLQYQFFSWIPSIENGFTPEYSRGVLIRTYFMVALFGAVTGPVVEELYFRGHLLPRMSYAGKWAPLLHSFLFGIYHIWTPWMFITRTIGMLPLIFAIRRRNLYIGIVVHILINCVDVIVGVVFIMRMSRVA